MLIAFETNVLKWPGMNEAFLFSFILSTAGAPISPTFISARPESSPSPPHNAACTLHCAAFIAFY